MRLAWSADRSRLSSREAFDPREADLTADELFGALDGRSFSLSHQTWRIAIYSIHDQQPSRWIQVGLGGRPQCSVTLRVAVDASVDEIMETLADSLKRTSPTDSILSVASVH